MITGTIKEVQALDKILKVQGTLLKDGSKSGSDAFVKVYAVEGNPSWKRVRLFFDKRTNTGTVKIRDYKPAYLGVCTFLLIQVGVMVQESVVSIANIL